MLPLVSSAMPRLTGTRSLLKCVIGCGSSSSYTRKSSFRSPETKRPFWSVTVAVTLISSTPVRKRNDCPLVRRRWLLGLLRAGVARAAFGCRAHPQCGSGNGRQCEELDVGHRRFLDLLCRGAQS